MSFISIYTLVYAYSEIDDGESEGERKGEKNVPLDVCNVSWGIVSSLLFAES